MGARMTDELYYELNIHESKQPASRQAEKFHIFGTAVKITDWDEDLRRFFDLCAGGDDGTGVQGLSLRYEGDFVVLSKDI